MTWIDRLLAGSGALFILAELLAASIPGLSRLVHVSVVLMLLALVLKAGNRGLHFRADPLLIAFWAFFVYSFASILWSGHEMTAAIRAAGMLVDVTGATLLWVALWNGLSLRWIVGCAGVAAGIQAAVALNQFWSGVDDRVSGLTNPNEMAVQLSLVAFLLLLAGGRHWLSGVGGLALIIIATITSGSRKMVFVWGIYLLLVARWLSLGLRRSTLTAAALMLLLPVAVLAALEYREAWLTPIENLTVYERLERAIAGEDNSANVRENLIVVAIDTWQTSPMWGHGLDQFRLMNSYFLYSHNNYTELLTNLGLIGFLLYYAIHLNLGVRALQVARRGSSRGWLICLLLLMLMILDVARVSHTDQFTWTLLAIVAFICQQEEARSAEAETPAGGIRVAPIA